MSESGENWLIFGEIIRCTKNDAIFWPTLYHLSVTNDDAFTTDRQKI